MIPNTTPKINQRLKHETLQIEDKNMEDGDSDDDVSIDDNKKIK